MLLAIGFVFFAFGFAAALAFGQSSAKVKVQLHQYAKALGLQKASFEWLLAFDHHDQLPYSSSGVISEVASGKLFTKSEVERQFEPGSWQRLAYDDFKAKILARESGSRTFPCVYATLGYRSDDHRYVFLESNDPAEPRNIRIIGPALKKYLSIAKQLGPNTSLVIVSQPTNETKSVNEYNDSFWKMLRGLRIWDRAPWPADVPQMIESEKWTFSFDGEPIFPVLLTPAHQLRWSRHMSVPIIALQPKWVLDLLLATPAKRKDAQGKVRKLLQAYDQVDVSPDLTSYGAPGTSESRQLCLMDENETARCPFKNLDEQ